MSMTFDTKVAIVLCDDMATWQKLNVTAFLVSGIVGSHDGLIGENYRDASGRRYAPMLVQPMMVYTASPDALRKAYDRAIERDVRLAIFTRDLFATGNDIDNRAAVAAVAADDLPLVGIAMRDLKKTVEKVIKGLSLHP
jgi:hypothetical protein